MIRAKRAPYPGDLLEHLRALATLGASLEKQEPHPFARTASQLAVDTSVLRRRLATLATFVGAPLVEGRGPELRLTKTGARVRERAVRTLDVLADLGSDAGHDTGPLRVACTGTFLGEVLPQALAALRARHPQLRFRVHRAGSAAARELLERGELDFAIVRGDRDHAPAGPFASRRIGHDHLWLAASANSAIARTKKLSLEAIAREPLIGYGRTSATMHRVMQVLGPLGATPWVEVEGKAAALSYVNAGLGVAFISLLAGQKPARRGVVARNVTATFPRAAFWLLWPARATLDRWHADFAARVSTSPPQGRR